MSRLRWSKLPHILILSLITPVQKLFMGYWFDHTDHQSVLPYLSVYSMLYEGYFFCKIICVFSWPCFFLSHGKPWLVPIAIRRVHMHMSWNDNHDSTVGFDCNKTQHTHIFSRDALHILAHANPFTRSCHQYACILAFENKAKPRHSHHIGAYRIS